MVTVGRLYHIGGARRPLLPIAACQCLTVWPDLVFCVSITGTDRAAAARARCVARLMYFCPAHSRKEWYSVTDLGTWSSERLDCAVEKDMSSGQGPCDFVRQWTFSVSIGVHCSHRADIARRPVVRRLASQAVAK